MRRTLVAALICSASVVGAGASAFAGEVTGNGQSLEPLHANSPCAFSGLEDWVSTTVQPEGGILVQPGVVQNWGHTKKVLQLLGATPKGANSVDLSIIGMAEEGCNAREFGMK